MSVALRLSRLPRCGGLLHRFTACQKRLQSSDVRDRCRLRRKITKEDVGKFAVLTGDTNPVHSQGDCPMVHGALLVGMVSGVLGAEMPGAGTVVLALEADFVSACPVGTEVTIDVRLVGDRRKVSVCEFECSGDDGRSVFVKGKCRLRMPKK